MATAVIDRIGFNRLLSDERADLAQKAKASLGYNRLAQAITMTGALLFALRELAIEPFSPAGVEKYKASKRYKGMYSGTKTVLWAVFFIAAFAGAALFDCQHGCFAMGATMGVFAFVSIIVTLGSLDEWDSGDRTVRSWKTFRLEGYTGTVPEYVLDRAVRIKERCPSATFYVDQLIEESEHRTRPDRDPFLRAVLGDEEYFIDVWDEKEYEKSI